MQEGTELEMALTMENASKHFPGTIAVDNVDFEVKTGEVHALIGENGAGKSTLMKMLAGSFNDYTGTIKINGKEVKLHSPAIAKSHGIGMVYQELSLALPISIAENLLVGRIPKKGLFINRKEMLSEARKNLERVGLSDIDPNLPVEEISQHEAQLVEIAKVLGNSPHILVMDEPTSALSREEVERLFSIIDKLKSEGLAVVYISHHLPEIFRVADRVTILRDGRKIKTCDIDTVTSEELVQMMVGKSVAEFYQRNGHEIGEERLRVEKLSRYGFFHNISFTARKGEILGICGLSGAGRSELARVLIGLDDLDEGKIYINGRPANTSSMAKALESGIAYLTENRKTEGLALRLSSRENVLAGIVPQLSKGGVYNSSAGDETVKRLYDELSVYPKDPDVTVGNLSGGNQQKVLLAKWMACEPDVLILDEPTRGVDIGAKMIIHKSIEKLAESGNTIILISSDLPELVSLADRVLIMRQGHFIREMDRSECTEESVLLAANGEGGKS